VTAIAVAANERFDFAGRTVIVTGGGKAYARRDGTPP
jgi:hypothetical protein